MKYTLKPCKHSSTKYCILKFVVDVQIRGSIVVSISACHADDPGSIPGRGVFEVNARAAIMKLLSEAINHWRLWEWATS